MNDQNENQGAPFGENASQGGGGHYYDAPLYRHSFGAEPTPPASRSFSIASLVLGIVSMVCCCFFFVGIPCAVLAIIFAILSRKRTGSFDGLAIAGLVLGIFGLALTIWGMMPVDPATQAEMEKWLEEYLKEMQNA